MLLDLEEFVVHAGEYVPNQTEHNQPETDSGAKRHRFR
jgi:hypothetical protein